MHDILAKLRADMELRNYSSNTRESYERTCRSYIEFLGSPADLAGTGEAEIRAYATHLSGRGLAASTVDLYLAAVLFMYEVTLDKTVNRRQVPFMKKPKTLPKTFSREEMARMLSEATNPKHAAIVSLGYGSGLRISEVCSLRVRDIDSAQMRVLVESGKGDKDRWTILSEVSLRILREYWRRFRPEHPEGWLFLGPYGYTHITDHAARNALAACMAAAGVPKDGRVFHSLRYHTLQFIATFAEGPWCGALAA